MFDLAGTLFGTYFPNPGTPTFAGRPPVITRVTSRKTLTTFFYVS
jgi:hypothetical protein